VVQHGNVHLTHKQRINHMQWTSFMLPVRNRTSFQLRICCTAGAASIHAAAGDLVMRMACRCMALSDLIEEGNVLLASRLLDEN
jgi:hypothetical protein